ncbi:MAG: tetratricopeptide repeat protein [Alphaproteobacteria bacterium]|nr:tetratricopeptide repeat protein [Alphaproteobacteria bacterium]
MRRTAFIAKPATSRIRRKTFFGPSLRAAEALITPTCRSSVYRAIAVVAAIAFAAACASTPPGAPIDASLSSINAGAALPVAPIEQPTAGRYLVGRIAARENDVPDAATAFDAVAGAHDDDRKLARQAFFYSLAAGDIDAALGHANRLRALNESDPEWDLEIDESPEDTDGLARLAIAAEELLQGDYPAAAASLEFSSNEPFVASMAHIIRAWAAVGAIDADAGLEALQTDIDGLFTGFHPLHAAFMADRGGRTSLAMDAYRNSVFGLGGPIGRAAYGAFLERSGDPKAAEGYYELLTRQPGPDRRLAAAGLARLKKGVASDEYSNVTPQEGAAIAFYSFAAFLLEQFAEQREQADAAGFNVGEPRYNLPLALAQVALRLDPGLAEARRLAGVIYNIYDDAPSAVAALEPIPQSSPHYVQAQIEIAGGLARQGRDREAMSRLEQVARRYPDAEEARFALSNLAAGNGDFEGAVRHLTKLIDQLGASPTPDAWRYFVARADALLKLDRWPAAEVDLKKAVELSPEEPTALNYLGYLWAERGVNLDQAFELIEKAVEADRTSGAIIDSLGWAHYQVGDYQEAVDHLETAAALEPADPTITEHLGDVYWRLGRRIEARFQWDRALELDPADGHAEKIKAKLASGLPGIDARSERTPSDRPASDAATSPIMTSAPINAPVNRPVIEPGDAPARREPPDL